MNRLLLLLITMGLLLPQPSSAQCMSSLVSGTSHIRLFSTTGDPQLDAALNGQAAVLGGMFGVTPNLYTLEDSQAANAYADCKNNRVMLGLRLLKEELWTMSQGGVAVAGILAHEFAHIYQCAQGSSLSGKYRELQADWLAGWYLGKTSALMGTDVSSFAVSLWKKGDYNFRDPNHHGTPKERVAAMVDGFRSSTGSASAAYKASLSFLQSGSSGSGHPPTPAVPTSQRMCTKRVPCTHPTPCQHKGACTHPVRCQHLTTCRHPVPCQHLVATPYGPRTLHQVDAAHPYDQMHTSDAAHVFDLLHESDALHPYDEVNVRCD